MRIVADQDSPALFPDAVEDIAGFSPLFLEECPIRQAENIIRVLSGQKPHGLANPEVIKIVAVMHETNTGRWAGVPGFSTAMAV